jgi:hypothetical protein
MAFVGLMGVVPILAHVIPNSVHDKVSTDPSEPRVD